MGYSSPPPSSARRVGREATLKSPSAAPEHTTQHEVEPCTDSRGPAPATPVYQRGLASPRPEACPAASSFGPEAKRRLKGRGQRYLEILHFLRPPSSAAAAATPDFLFFFTGIFRPPLRGGQASRGRGSLLAEDSSGLAPASQRQQQEKEQSRQPAPERRSPAAARSQVPCPSFSAQSRGGVPACRHFGGTHWRQNADGAAPPRVTHSYSQRCSLTRMRIARGRK